MKAYYKNKYSKLYHGDCYDVIKTFPRNSIDLDVKYLEYAKNELENFGMEKHLHNYLPEEQKKQYIQKIKSKHGIK